MGREWRELPHQNVYRMVPGQHCWQATVGTAQGRETVFHSGCPEKVNIMCFPFPGHAPNSNHRGEGKLTSLIFCPRRLGILVEALSKLMFNCGRVSAVSCTWFSSCPAQSCAGCPSRRILLSPGGRCLLTPCQTSQSPLCAPVDDPMSSMDVFSLGLPHCA